MRTRGYADGDYKILAQTYSAPLPRLGGFRYPETGFTRQTVGGCGVWNSDANWARNTVVDTLNNTIKNAVAGMANVQVLDMVGALNGRRLCENTVGLLEEKGVSTWQSAGRGRQDRVGAPDPHAHARSSRPTSCRRTGTRTTGASSRCATASARPTTAAPHAAGTCTRDTTGLNGKGEPNMRLAVPAP